MVAEENKERVRRFMKAFEEGDLATFTSLMDPDCKIWTAGKLWFSGHYNIEEMKERAAKLLPQFPHGMRFYIRSMIAEGDRVAAEIESDAPHFTGAVYHNYYHFLWEFRDGRIVMFKEYLDTAMAEALLGVEAPNLPPGL